MPILLYQPQRKILLSFEVSEAHQLLISLYTYSNQPYPPTLSPLSALSARMAISQHLSCDTEYFPVH